jgi:hypothetical protein
MATMEEVLVPLYMYHRFQVTAAASALGGMHYIYALRGDGRTPVRPVPAEEQQAALEALLTTLDPAELTIPRSILEKLPPRPAGYGRTRELFPRYTGLMFDAVSPATVAANHTLSEILRGDRAARMVEQHALDASLPGLEEVLDQVVKGTFGKQHTDTYQAEISRAVERVFVDQMMTLASNASMPQVRAIAAYTLQNLSQQLDNASESLEKAHRSALVRDITSYLERATAYKAPPVTLSPPPGAPIGQPAMDWLGQVDPACSYLDW